MATVNKDFKIKYGLIVEGTTATVNGASILTRSSADQNYIIGLIGGSATSLATPSTVVLRDANANFAAGTITANLVGNVTGTVSSLSNHDTDDLAEGSTNQYFTAQRALTATAFAYDATGSAYSAELAARGYADSLAPNYDAAGEASQALISANANTEAVVDALTTEDIEESITGINRYFTDNRARDAVGSGDGLNYNSTTGVFSAHLGTGLEISVTGAIQIDDNIVATELDLSDAIDNHNAGSGVHGVTGEIVGTTDIQTISNKTLGTSLAAGGFKITNLGTPENSTDAATKGYVDAVSEGLHIHEAARVAVDGNIAIATALENGDLAGGVTLAAGDRVLVKDQAVASENGIYVVQISGQAIRAVDFDTAQEVASGDFIFVSEGTYANTGWVQTLNPATIGTDPISFTQFSGAGTFTAGNGLLLNGTVFSIDETITATVSYVGAELDAHIDLTEDVHGVAGSVVGTSGAQTLTNKTLGSGTVLSANIDAANIFTVSNLEEPVNGQDAATKAYVDGEISTLESSIGLTVDNLTTTDIEEGTRLYFTDQRALEATASAYDAAGLAFQALTDANANTNMVVNALTTDDIEEGLLSQYFTDQRAQMSAGLLLTKTETNLTNIQITANANGGLDIVAENGVANSTTNDLAEGSTNKYFTAERAVDALEAVVPKFTAIEINDIAKETATTVTVSTPGTATAFTWDTAVYRTVKALVKFATANHTEVSEILLTMDGLNNIAITEYGEIGTNGSMGTVTATVVAGEGRIDVTTLNNATVVFVKATLLV